MKRSFHEVDSITMANCLMLLSQGRETMSFPHFESALNHHNNIASTLINTSSNRVFECKTCNRQFPSFQALGGHRASHKKPRLMATDGSNNNSSSETHSSNSLSSPAKPKTHECSICGLEFAIGQALGGHMRRHRTVINEHQTREMTMKMKASPIVKKSNSRRVLCLDLNLTPFENDLELFKVGKTAPMVDCLI
ncbi:C2H2-type zinc finger family protein [Euphorbia peplus]|nr:C2H2-type zinc finger family protein [Euphorbia peplus]